MPSSQAANEQQMSERGAAKARRRIEIAKKFRLESTTVSGQRLLREGAGHMIEAVESWLLRAIATPGRNHSSLEDMQRLPAPLMAVLATKGILDSLSQERVYTRVASAIGIAVEDECRGMHVRKKAGLWKVVQKDMKRLGSYRLRNSRIRWTSKHMDEPFEPWPPKERVRLGIVLLELFIESTGLVETYLRSMPFRRPGFKQRMVIPTEATLLWIEQSDARSELLAPYHMPCVAPPKDWTGPMNGGFHTDAFRREAVMKTHDRALIAEMAHADMGLAYSALNSLQNTKWQVNRRVYDVFETLWEVGEEVAGLPRRTPLPMPFEDPMPEKGSDDHRELMRRRAITREYNISSATKRLSTAQLLHTAREFLQEPAIYFVHQLDWRGRCYPIASGLQPQGPDIAKSLLQFGIGLPISDDESENWHAIHGANCWGMDKVSYEDRIQWADDHAVDIMRVADNPLGDSWWEEADEPWQFLAWCFDRAAYLQDPKHHLSHLPCHQDATQSGIQIFSLLLRDPEGAKSTNCTPSDTPQDLYGAVAEKTVELLRADGSPEALEWIEFGIDRKALKRPVMTRVYNSKKQSCLSYLRDWAYEKGREEDVPPPKSFKLLGAKAWEAMQVALAGMADSQKWLAEVARVFSRLNMSIRWTTPVGLIIKQTYRRQLNQSVRTTVGENIRVVRLQIDTEKMSTPKMANAFAPNLIHSLDAAAMVGIVNQAASQGIPDIAAIHDSFATHAANSQALAVSIREAYVQIFEGNYLKTLKAELETYLPEGVELPELPAMGDLDITLIRESLYFFN